MTSSMKKRLALLLIAAAAAVLYGAWEITSDRLRTGVGLIAIAIVDVLLVTFMYAKKVRRHRSVGECD
jgi:hypothetical protein